jgi:hypothetical protein
VKGEAAPMRRAAVTINTCNLCFMAVTSVQQ